MAWEPSESDGPETVWARAHDHELVGMSEPDAVAKVNAAGFRAFVFHPADGHALAAMKIRNTVTLICSEDIVRRVRS